MSSEQFQVNLTDCQTILKNSLNHEDFEILDFQQLSLKGKVEGIMAGHYKIQIKYKTNKATTTKNFFMKSMKANYKIQNKVIKQQRAYEKESFMYNIFFKNLNKIKNYSVNYIPQCYFTREEEIIVLEDVGESGYKTYLYPNYTIDVVHCKLALDTVAKFHAGTIIYEQEQITQNKKNYSLLEEYPEMFSDPIYQNKDDFLGNHLFKTGCKTILSLIDINPNIIDKNHVKNIFTQHAENIYELVKPAKNFRNVICHSDLWSNNILFKHENGSPVDCILIDFQALRYTVPAQDVLYLISQLQDDSEETTEMLLKLYHNSLKKYLEQHNINVNDFLSYEEFKKSCDYTLPMIIIQNCVLSLMSIMVFSPEVFQDGDLFAEFMYEENMKTRLCVELYEKTPAFKYVIDKFLNHLNKLQPIV